MFTSAYYRARNTGTCPPAPFPATPRRPPNPHPLNLVSPAHASAAPVRLVSKGESVRHLNPKYLPAVRDAFDHEPQTAFSDGWPFLILSEESIADLNTRLPKGPVQASARNFRPNIVVAGCLPYEVRRLEDAKTRRSGKRGGQGSRAGASTQAL